jgi:hypothetical protein
MSDQASKMVRGSNQKWQVGGLSFIHMNCSVPEGKLFIIERCAGKGRGTSTDLGEQERCRLSKAKTKFCELLAFAAN